MRIKNLKVRNFRLLDNIEENLDLEAHSTIIVWRNNSWKTSLTELFKKFLNDWNKFQFEDISVSSYEELRESITYYREFKAELNEIEKESKEIVFTEKTPRIELQITFIIEHSDNNLPLQWLDLDDTTNEYTLLFEYTLKNKNSFYENALTEPDFIEYLKKNFEWNFEMRTSFIDSLNKKNKYTGDIKQIFKVDFIDAQRHLDDNSSDKNKTLSKVFETYFNKNKGSENMTFISALEWVNSDLDSQYATFFGSLHTDLHNFWYPGLWEKDKKLILKSELEAKEILKWNNAKIYYSQDTNILPESYNGLWYSNLIYIILQLLYLYGEFDKLEPKPQFQVLFIEEPEAHLHPQMQQTFIKQIEKFVTNKWWNIQIIITTHSSHIISSSNFSKIRYFHKKEIWWTEIKNLAKFEDSWNKEFICKYLTLEKSDMFFADKLIMIEWMVERILLPLFVQKIDLTISDEKEKLSSQYISIIEIWWAYAHKFEEFLKFLGIKTLIITDLDSIDKKTRQQKIDLWLTWVLIESDDSRDKAYKVSESTKTSNSTLKSWIPKKEAISELILMSNVEKEQDNFRVAYQVEENWKIGRSFEDAFILANAEILASFNKEWFEILKSQFETLTKDQILESWYWDIAQYIDKNNKKTDFAFDIMMMDDFIVPKYIKEGLIWLSKD